MDGFALEPRLESDTIAIGESALSRVLLMNDARYPWVVLVPRRANLAELTDLTSAERTVLIEEIAIVSTALSQRRGADKINVGALGNIVRQLHIHVIARSVGDEAWPGAVWGVGVRRPYDGETGAKIAGEIAQALHQILTMRTSSAGASV
jgi:diadenosine tetraphosphate (Ap4A) HIT family hydrolase